MTSPLLAALVVLMAWWLSTGLILWRVRVADNIGPSAHVQSVIYGLPLAALGVWGAIASRDSATAAQIYLGFGAALSLWAWIELAFLSGVITGPNRSPCPKGLPTSARLSRAITAIAWHEAALLAGMLWLIALQWGAANPMAGATFALLLIARSLAKINLFLGVPRINLQFIPSPITHLISHFRIGPATVFFPISIAILAAMILAGAAFAVFGAASLGQQLGLTLLGVLAALALLEHFFMILPLPDAKLWTWMLPKPKQTITILKD